MHVYDDITPEKVSLSLSLSLTHVAPMTKTRFFINFLLVSFVLGHVFQAQAIMFLAGNGSAIASNTAHPKAQVQAPSSKLAAGDGVPANQPINSQPCSGLSSPLSVSSHTGAQSGSGSTSNDELMAAKTNGVPSTPVSKVEPQKIANVVGSVPVTPIFPSGKS